MKKLILILLIIILLFGCEKKNKIELIPNLDLLYISAKDVKIPPIPIDTLLAEKLNKGVMSFLKNKNEKHTSLKILKLSFRLYVDETGKVDYIKVINNQINPEPLKQKQERINLSEEILNEWIKRKEYWNFYPAKLSEKPIKSSIDILSETGDRMTSLNVSPKEKQHKKNKLIYVFFQRDDAFNAWFF